MFALRRGLKSGWRLITLVCCAPDAGAHVNPAVSLAMVILGKLPLKKFPVYVLAQFLGAFAGSCAVYGLYYGETHVPVTR